MYFRDPTFLFFLIIMAGAVVTFRSWRALIYETYDKRSRSMNRYSFRIGLIITATGILLTYWWVKFISGSMQN